MTSSDGRSATTAERRPTTGRTDGPGEAAPVVGDFLPGTTRRAFTASHFVVGTLALLVLAVLTPLAMVDWSANSISATNLALGALVLLFAAWRLTRALTFEGGELLRGFFYVFVYINFGVAAMAQAVTGRYPLDNRTYDDLTVTHGYLVVLLGIAAYEVGWYLRTCRRTSSDSVAPRRWLSFSPARVVVMGLVGLGVVTYQVTSYGLTTFFVSKERTSSILAGQGTETGIPLYATDDKAGGVLTAFVSQGLVFVALFAVLYCRRYRHWPPPRSLAADGLWRLFIGALVVANVVMNNPIGNGRFWSLLVFASLLSIFLPYRRPRSVRIFIAGALLVLLFVFASLDLFRYTSQTRELDLSAPGETFVTNGTYAMFQMNLNGAEYLDRESNTYGRQLLGAALVFVPRSLWTDKPIATGQVIDGPLPRSATAWTELETDFGAPGVLLFFVAYGYGSAVLTRRGEREYPGSVHAVLPMIAVFQIAFLRGSFLPIMGIGYQVIGLVAVLLVLRRADDDTTGGHGTSGRAGTDAGPPQAPAVGVAGDGGHGRG